MHSEFGALRSEMNTRFDGIQRTMIGLQRTLIGVMGSILVGFAGLFVSHL
jgi:hypothetical protein